MDIKVVGAGCEDCDTVYARVKECCVELNINEEIDKVEDLVEMVMLGVMSVPAIMIDGKIVSSGNVPSKEKIIELLKKYCLQ